MQSKLFKLRRQFRWGVLSLFALLTILGTKVSAQTPGKTAVHDHRDNYRRQEPAASWR